jgi:hypothetical protein
VKRIRRIVAALVSFLTGVPQLTPRQKARLAEIEQEHAGRSPADLANPQGCSVKKL